MSKSSKITKIECLKGWISSLPYFKERKKLQIKKQKQYERESEFN